MVVQWPYELAGEEAQDVRAEAQQKTFEEEYGEQTLASALMYEA